MSRSGGNPDDAGQEFFSEFLACARIEQGLTWADLAGALGVGQSTLGHWLNGTHLPRTGPGSSQEPPREKLALFAAALGYPVEHVTTCWLGSLASYGGAGWRLAVCQRGHDMPLDAPPGSPCQECEEWREKTRGPAYRKAGRERRAKMTCSACGTLGIHTGSLCVTCYDSQKRYGDPLDRSMHPKRKSASGFCGVGHVPAASQRPWKASITHRGKNYYLGHHATAEDAARAYDAKATELRGTRARLNFPPHPA